MPKLLGWTGRRIADRVEEMLDLVGLDPAAFHGRYPRQLSGGQQQRVGVARALAADPPVMLMDEPFGAVDPITREHLQDEFLRLQQQLRKTIVFVTHDFDEAIKLGDRIAVLRERSHIAQYDTPARRSWPTRPTTSSPASSARTPRSSGSRCCGWRTSRCDAAGADRGLPQIAADDQPARGPGRHARARHRPLRHTVRRAHLRRAVATVRTDRPGNHSAHRAGQEEPVVSRARAGHRPEEAVRR